MTPDFQTPIDRTQTHSLKWERYKGRDILPFWVADMDFAAPPAVLAALSKRLAHPVLGYGVVGEEHNQSFLDYALRHYSLTLSSEQLVWMPGLVPALNLVSRFVQGDVIVMPPVYPPFLKAPLFNQKKRIDVPLIAPTCAPKENENTWQIDFDGLQKAFQQAAPDSVLLLCHPHNPVGRAWKTNELKELLDLAKHHQILICSDEIHADLMLNGQKHTPLVALDDHVITLMAPSKTYNLPGLATALAIIPNPHLRRRFNAAKSGIIPDVNILGLEAAQAAFSQCDSWREKLIEVLQKNQQTLFQTVNAQKIGKMHWVEATYLAWIDMREITNPVEYFERFGLGLSEGADFGAPGFVRLNFGTTPKELDCALTRYVRAIEHFQR